MSSTYVVCMTKGFTRSVAGVAEERHYFHSNLVLLGLMFRCRAEPESHLGAFLAGAREQTSLLGASQTRIYASAYQKTIVQCLQEI